MERFSLPRHSLQRQSARVVGPLDIVFRGLAIVGMVEAITLIVTLIADPSAPGLIGQGLFLRIWFGLIVAPAILLVGALGVWRAPGNAVGRFLVLIALGGIGAQFDIDLGAPIPTALAVEAIVLFNAGLVGPSLGYLMLTFPTGRVYPPHWRRVVIVVAVVKFVGVLLEILASPGQIKIFVPTLNPLFLPVLAPYQPVIAWTIGITGLLMPLILLAGLISLVMRYRAAAIPERQQIKWVMWGFGLLVPVGATTFGLIFRYGFADMPFQITYVFAASAQTLFLISIAIAILRYHLFDIDILINRTLVYASLTLIVVGVYVLAVGYLSELFHERGNFILSLLATGLIAVLFQPLRQRLQRAVNRLMYGDRDDPYAVLSRLGQSLEATLAPDSVLPAIVETIAQTLKLPYAAISFGNADSQSIATAYGLPQPDTLALPLRYQHDLIGHLHVAQRSPDEPFTAAEQHLLNDIARQIGVAAHNVRLTADLQHSRERLVTTREEERRRIRRDLHDGLGPTLASHSYRLDAALDLIDQNPDAAKKLIADLKTQTQTTLTDIRRLVYELRPPALDELGLIVALQAQWVAQNGLRVSIESPANGLPPLSAAVEVAAYRIAMEAVTNAARHAEARNCRVCFTAKESELTVEAADDGKGIANGARSGVGLTSMKERAAELGGVCVIESPPMGGTRVYAKLPLTK